MCLVLFAHGVHPEYRLVLAANRDEFHARPTASAHRWPEAPTILAGRDLERGGTWLGVTDSGRWAAVTNYRAPAELAPGSLSRGHLVVDFLTESVPSSTYISGLLPRLDDYGGFNLVVGDAEDVAWISNRAPREGGDPFRRLEPGVYGVSNHLLDTPWPKVARGKYELSAILTGEGSPTPEALLELLMDRTYAADHELPDTGVGRELERSLSASFISTPEYGTRSSTALLITRRGRIYLSERRFDAAGTVLGEAHFEV